MIIKYIYWTASIMFLNRMSPTAALYIVMLSLASCGGGAGKEADAQAVPLILSLPHSRVVEENTTTTFEVVATGDELTYQWLKNEQEIEGAIHPRFETEVLSDDDSGSVYSVFVSNDAGTVVGKTVLLSAHRAVSGTVERTIPEATHSTSKCGEGGAGPKPAKLTITSQPDNAKVVEGKRATFRVEATGATCLTYQWKKNGQSIKGAIDNIYITGKAKLSDNRAKYSVVVSDGSNKLLSKEAKLTVTLPPDQINVPITTVRVPYVIATSGDNGTLNDDSNFSNARMSDNGRFITFAQLSGPLYSNSFGQRRFSSDGCRQTVFIKDIKLKKLHSFSLAKVSGICSEPTAPLLSGDGRYLFMSGYGPVLYRDLVVRGVDTVFRTNIETGVVDNAPRQEGGFSNGNNGTYGYGDPLDGTIRSFVSGVSGESFAFIINDESLIQAPIWHRRIKNVTSGSKLIVGQDPVANHGNGGPHRNFLNISQDGRYIIYGETFTTASRQNATRYIRYDSRRQVGKAILTEFAVPGTNYLMDETGWANICGMNSDASKLMIWGNIRNPRSKDGKWSTGLETNTLIYDVGTRSLTLGQNMNMTETVCTPGHFDFRPAQAMSADGNILVSGDGGNLYVFNVKKNKTIRIEYTGFATDFQISRDGKYILQYFSQYDNLADGTMLTSKYPYAKAQYFLYGPIFDAYFN